MAERSAHDPDTPFVEQTYLNPVLATGNDEGIRNHLRIPVPAQEVVGHIGIAAISADDGLTGLVSNLYYAQQLPYYSGRVVDDKYPGRDHLKVPGRVAEVVFHTDYTQGKPVGDRKTIIAVDAHHTSGEIWAQAAIIQADHSPLGTPQMPMKHAYGMFVFDPNARNEAQSLDPAYADGELESGDWRLEVVLTDLDTNPNTGSLVALTDSGSTTASLTKLAPIEFDLQTKELGRNVDNAQLLRHVHQLVNVFHQIYYESEPYDYSADENLKPGTIEFIRQFEHLCVTAPELIGVPLRAWELLAMRNQALRDGSISESKYAAYEESIYKDVLLASMMARVRDRGGYHAKVRKAISSDGSPHLRDIIDASPVRWTAQLRDPFAVLIENEVMGPLRGNEDLAVASQEYLRKIQKLPKNSVLSVMPTSGNTLLGSTSLWGDLEQIDYYGHTNEYIPYEGVGIYYPEAVSSLYRYQSALQLGGMVVRLQAGMPENHQEAPPTLVVDLMKAPSVLLRSIVDKGYFNGQTADDMGNPTLSSMLLAQYPAELIVGSYEKPEQSQDRGNANGAQPNIFKVYGHIGVNGICHIIGEKRTTGGRAVVYKARAASEVANSISQQQDKTQSRWRSRKKRKNEEVQADNDSQIRPNETLLASFGLKGGGFQIRVGANNPTVKVTTMRNAGPVGLGRTATSHV